ncbi:MAG: sulfur carrier protein ThiS [Lentisphaeria bacterium]
MRITVNGKAQEAPEALRLTELLARLGLKPERVVVERNGEVVGRDRYGETVLAAGDTLELLSFVGGG